LDRFIISGNISSSCSFCIRHFLAARRRRFRQKTTRIRMRRRKMTPPTAPPMMATELCVPIEGAGVGVAILSQSEMSGK